MTDEDLEARRAIRLNWVFMAINIPLALVGPTLLLVTFVAGWEKPWLFTAAALWLGWFFLFYLPVRAWRKRSMIRWQAEAAAQRQQHEDPPQPEA